MTTERTMLMDLWLVCKAYPWDAVELKGPLPARMVSVAPGMPELFAPVFLRKEDALAFVGGDEAFLMHLKGGE